MWSRPLAERIERFVEDPAADDFDALALAAFAELYERDDAFRALCDRSGDNPAAVRDRRAIPAVEPAAEPWTERVAGPLTGLQRRLLERGLFEVCAGELERPPVLTLIPASTEPIDRELTEACAAAARRAAGDGSTDAVAGQRVEVNSARSWLAARQRDRRPALLLATDGALERLLGALERQDLRFQLARGSRVVVARELAEGALHPAGELAARCRERLGLESPNLIRQRRWPGVPTALYEPARAPGRTPWLRLDPPDGRAPASALDLTITGRPFKIALAG